MNKSTFEFTVGRMFIGKARDYLDKQKFKGLNIDYMESSGWIEHDFVVKGDGASIAIIAADINRWFKELAE